MSLGALVKKNDVSEQALEVRATVKQIERILEILDAVFSNNADQSFTVLQNKFDHQVTQDSEAKLFPKSLLKDLFEVRALMHYGVTQLNTTIDRIVVEPLVLSLRDKSTLTCVSIRGTFAGGIPFQTLIYQDALLPAVGSYRSNPEILPAIVTQVFKDTDSWHYIERNHTGECAYQYRKDTKASLPIPSSEPEVFHKLRRCSFDWRVADSATPPSDHHNIVIIESGSRRRAEEGEVMRTLHVNVQAHDTFKTERLVRGVAYNERGVSKFFRMEQRHSKELIIDTNSLPDASLSINITQEQRNPIFPPPGKSGIITFESIERYNFVFTNSELVEACKTHGEIKETGGNGQGQILCAATVVRPSINDDCDFLDVWTGDPRTTAYFGDSARERLELAGESNDPITERHLLGVYQDTLRRNPLTGYNFKKILSELDML